MELIHKLEYIAEKNGLEKIWNKLAEECAELAAAHMKIVAEGENSERLAARRSELADVRNLLIELDHVTTQAELHQIGHCMEQKADRTLRDFRMRREIREAFSEAEILFVGKRKDGTRESKKVTVPWEMSSEAVKDKLKVWAQEQGLMEERWEFTWLSR